MPPEDEATRIERLLAAVRSRGARTDGPAGAGPGPGGRVLLGPGDDAAVLRPPAGHDLVWTVDDQVEGVHFERQWGWEHVGARAAAACLSDLAAMGARPFGLLLALHLPPATDGSCLDAFGRGLGDALAAAGCPLVGGNVTRHPERVAVSLSALGLVARGRALRRDAGRPGDVLAVTGPLGLARLGLAAARAGRLFEPGLERARQALLRPRPRLDLVPVLEALTGADGPGRLAVMDLSDGLARDLPRLALASGLAAVVDGARLPGPPLALAAALGPGGEDPPALAWLGGEDYELLVAATPALFERARAPLGLVAIGRLEAGVPGRVALEGALAGRADLVGFDHFAGAPGA